MRAMVVTSPGPVESLRMRQLVQPRPGPAELAINVRYAGVGFVDTLFRSGVFPLPTPFVPGIEVTGHVREVGPGVTDFEPGQAVAALLNDFGRGMRTGGYAEVALAHAGMTTRLQDGADLADVAAVLVNGVTAWIALHDMARLDVREDVVVLGASGGLGGIAGRIAALRPARRVIGVVGRPVAHPMDKTVWTDVLVAADLDAGIAELTNGRGIDVIIDPVGGELRTRAYGHLAPFGRHVVLGNASGEDVPITGDSTWHGTRHLLGLSLGGVAHLIPDRISAALTAIVDLVHRDILREPSPVIAPLDHAAEVHRALEERTAPPKTVLAIH